MKIYILTIKNNTHEYTSIASLMSAYSLLYDSLPRTAEASDLRSIELDSLNRLHLHNIITFQKTPYLKRIIQSVKKVYKTFQVHFQEIPLKDYSRAFNYVRKEPRSKYYLEQESFISFLNQQCLTY